MIKINKRFFIYIIIIVIATSSLSILYSFLFIIIHEIAHLLVARFFKYKGYTIEIDMSGARLRYKDMEDMSIKEDIIISLSGPIINIIMGSIFYLLNLYEEMSINYILGFFNLIPIIPLDGGRVLKNLLTKRYLYKKANIITIYISIVIGMFFLVISIILGIKFKFNISLILISILIIYCAYREKKRIVYVVMGDLMKKRERFFKKGYIESIVVSISYNKSLLSVLTLIDKSKYTLFYILDDTMNVIKIISEEEVLKGAKEYGDITIKEYINLS